MSAPISAADIPWGATAATVSAAESGQNRPRVSQATRLVDLALNEGAELWYTATGDPYVTLRVAAHREHHALASRGVRDWLSRLHHTQTGRAPGSQAIADALTTLSGIARYDGAEHAVSVRVAGHDRRIYLDLGAPDWSAFEITSDDWQLITDPPVRFRRGRGMLALPRPERAGTTDLIAEMLGVQGDDAILIVAWLIGAFRPSGPYPVLSLSGEQGSGKSTRARMIRGLIDPHQADLRAEPREVRDLMIAASSGWIVALDNVSRVQDWLSDALCRVSTGGALGTRTLYSDSDETILSAIRPVILTGIAEVAHRGDLLDRCLSLTLSPLDDAHRRTEGALWAEYERQRPRLLGALLDAVSCALRREHEVRLSTLPRMADWAQWVTAAEPACGWSDGTLLGAYVGSRQSEIETMLDGDVLAAAIRRLSLPWTGTAAELLTAITPAATRPPQGWPASPRGLSAALRRLAPSLRRVGIDVQTGAREPGTGRRTIHVEEWGPHGHDRHTVTDAQQDGPDLRDCRCDDGLDRHARPSQAEARDPGLCDGRDRRDGLAPTLSRGTDDRLEARLR